MSKTLKGRPRLDWYLKAAKKLLRNLRARDPKAKLADAQLAVAREHGHASWRKLKEVVESQAAPVDSTAFVALIHKGDVKSAGKLLKATPALADARDAEGATALMIAVKQNKPAMVKLLLDHGADVTARYGRSAHTPLSWAMTVGAFKSAAVLLKAGVKPDLFCAAGLNAVDQLETFFDDRGYAIAGSSITGSSRYDAKGQLLKSPPDDPIERASDALYIAARNGQADAVRFLLTKKVDLAFRAYSGGTPLHWAYFSGVSETIRALLAAGADADDRNNGFAASPRAFGICVPASWGMMTQVKRQLRRDPALVNLREGRGTPLHESARGGHIGIAKTLLKAGANRSIRDNDGKTPADLARVGGHEELAKLLAPSADAASDDPAIKALPPHRRGHKIALWKPIMDAAYTGDAARIEKLLAAGADPNIVSTTPSKYRPLHRAIERKKSFKRGEKDVAAVKVLLAGGADPLLRGGWSTHTALQMSAVYEPLFIPVVIDAFKPLDIFHAAAVGDEDRVTALLKKDKSLATARDGNDWTPLHYAAASRVHEKNPAKSAALLKIAQLLLKAGADPMAAWNYNDEWPLRPLYYAAGWSNHPAMAEVLLKAGADPCDNESVYHAADEGYAECLELFEKYVPKKKLAEQCTMCLRTQFHWGHSKGAQWLLAHGADPNSLYPNSGNSALHAAAKSGANEKVIALLLQHGGDPKVKNKDGKTAIELARTAGKARVAKQLHER